MDAVIHNAGLGSGANVLMVNVVAPYLLTALLTRPDRLIYLSSSMHSDGRPNLDRRDWAGSGARNSYSDSKLLVTTLAATIGRLWPDVISSAVDPGWVPTKMGGVGATDDLREGHLTQEWLAVSDDPAALITGGYWHHKKRYQPHPSVNDISFQDQLISELERVTGNELPCEFRA